MTKSCLIPLNNVAGKGDFCAEVDIGSPPQRQHMLVDTGSSTLAVAAAHYKPELDDALTATQLCQHLAYGIGEWVGPVVTTHGTLGHGLHVVKVDNINLAIAETQLVDTFAHANGIFGLAYDALNIGHNMEAVTFPWTPDWDKKAQQSDFIESMLAQPKEYLSPLFDSCCDQGVIPDQFAFLVHRSSVFNSKADLTDESLMQHPLNRGLLALGNPHLHTHLHHADYVTVPLVCDKYYNVDLLGMRVGNQEMRTPPPFKVSGDKKQNSNCFFDSGASFVILPEALFKDLMSDLATCVPAQADLLAPYQQYNGKEVGVLLDKLVLADWPDIEFVFAGKAGAEVSLVISPYSYWQTHAPESNQASFKFSTLPGWKAQTILGLPLFCEYYTIFDRQTGEKGELAFANPKIAPHKLSDEIHHDWQTMKQFCQHLLHPERK